MISAKNSFNILICIGAVVFSTLSFGASSDGSYYMGIGVGASSNRFESNDTGFIMIPGSLSTVADTDISPNLYAGYQFNETFGVEGGYNKIGNFKIHVTMPNGVGIAENYKVGAWTLSGTVTKKFHNNFSVFGKLGAASTNVKNTYYLSNANDSKEYKFTKQRTNLLLVVGVKYSINQKIALRSEYENFGEVGSAISNTGEGTARARVSRLSLSVEYKF